MAVSGGVISGGRDSRRGAEARRTGKRKEIIPSASLRLRERSSPENSKEWFSRKIRIGDLTLEKED
jgi:hypothetical protein